MKIFLGLANVASIIPSLKKDLEDLGHQVHSSWIDWNTPIIQGKPDRLLNRQVKGSGNPLLRKYFFRNVWRAEMLIELYRASKKYDAFVFLWTPFMYDFGNDWMFEDLKWLKKRGKKIVQVFVGDDARWYYAAKQEFESYGFDPVCYPEYDYSVTGLRTRLLKIRKAEKWSDAIFSRLDQGQLELKPYYRWHMMVKTSAYPHHPEQKKRPLILHAPSSPLIKGTQYVLQAIEQLNKEGFEFDFKLIENMNHADAIKEYAKADIVIDQLVIPGTGKVSSECLAMGKVVLSHMAYGKYPQKNDPRYPVVDVNRHNILETLRSLIPDLEKRKQIASRGRAFADDVLDTRHFSRKVSDIFEGKNVPYDYTPDFFREKFIPESEDARMEYNKWTAYVKGCNWYKERIQPGEREGLIF
jgi:hypothetical protein